MKKLSSRYPITSIVLLCFVAGFVVYLFRGFSKEDKVTNIRRVTEVLGKDETCMNCHKGVQGLAPSHMALGCSPCHLGDPYEEDAGKSHEGMVLIPGNLSDVHQTCGTSNCHADIASRVENSLMSSMSGVISVNRFVFGETNSLSTSAHVKELGQSPADNHLRQLCASCHLGNEKTIAEPIHEKSRGGGCNACHLNYTKEGIKALENYHIERSEQNLPKIHPALNLEISNDHCFGCHSRSGRISTNYEGWHETLLKEEDIIDKEGFRLLEDRRVFEYVSPDIHHVAGLECIDCHNALEVMGDGKSYFHEEEQVETACADCHFNGEPDLAGFEDLDEESRKILSLRKWHFRDKQFLVGKKSGNPIINAILDENNHAQLIEKNSGKTHELKPPATICTKGTAHDKLTCTTCHTAWAPQCVGCHNTYDPEATGYDLLAKKKTNGKWIEHLGEFFAEPPSLGVVEELQEDSSTIELIKAFIPGMILSIDKSGYTKKSTDDTDIFHRLFAPAVSHTISAKGRSCKSCHNDPLALGYGRGQLIYNMDQEKGIWEFQPDYVLSEEDRLPQDAWIGFLKKAQGISTTRPNARPFTVQEQKRILTVGTCLSCHAENSEVMLNSLENFQETLQNVRDLCVLPLWK
ncbi:MAG: cytochrome c3 family protein [Bacteroidetes bacterium]|nr:cytochrome c3 family protein [Bacteroidota bacterium]